MKKIFFSFLLILSIGFHISAEEKQPIDLIIVMDTSSSMHRYYKDVSEYAIGPLIKSFLRFGDTFHLISFSGNPKLEISRKINGEEDVATIIARMLLLYPLNPYSDIISALAYSSEYLFDLPENRQKTLVFISDGEHAPQPGSVNDRLSKEDTNLKAADTAQRLKGNGWSFFFIQIPDSLEKTIRTVEKAVDSKAGSSSEDRQDGQVKSTGDTSAIRRSDTTTQPPAAKNPERTQRTSGTNPPGNFQQSSTVQADGAKSSDSSISDAYPLSSAEDKPTKTLGAIENTPTILDSVAEVLGAPVIEWEGKETQSQGEILSTAVGSISVVFPDNLGRIRRKAIVALTVKNPSPNPVLMETSAVLVNGVDRMGRRSFKKLDPRSQSKLQLNIEIPDEMPDGLAELKIEPVFAGSIRTTPVFATVKAEIISSSFTDGFVKIVPTILVVLGIGGAAFIAFLIILLAGRLHASPKRAIATASKASDPNKSDRLETEPTVVPIGSVVPAVSAIGRTSSAALATKRLPSGNSPAVPVLQERIPSERHSPAVQKNYAAAPTTNAHIPPSYDPPKVPYVVRKADGRVMLSLHVDDQNTAIGRRNIHLLKAGQVMTLGGGRSDFLVFLVRVPYRIADIRYDGERCILIPRRPDLFIDTGAQTIEDCIGKPIRIVSEKGYVLRFSIEQYENPLDSLNKFLHSIEILG